MRRSGGLQRCTRVSYRDSLWSPEAVRVCSQEAGELTWLTFASSVDRHLYFVHALPADATSISLPDLHLILNDYLNRNEAELVELKHEREARSWRKGEGKGKRETELEKLREEEESEYKTGFGESGFAAGDKARRNGC